MWSMKIPNKENKDARMLMLNPTEYVYMDIFIAVRSICVPCLHK